VSSAFRSAKNSQISKQSCLVASSKAPLGEMTAIAFVAYSLEVDATGDSGDFEGELGGPAGAGDDFDAIGVRNMLRSVASTLAMGAGTGTFVGGTIH
jgi:hypothetical protein